MASRRRFLATLLAASGAPALGWADAGSPAWLAAARDPDGAFALYGMSARAEERFRIPLPGRGHAAAAHPTAPEAVAFARRPGRFALVLDCAGGRVLHRLEAPPGRHFYGHGCFSADGETLYTTENHVGSGAGRIGLWSRSEGYRRIGEFASGGIGPHDIRRLPERGTLVVANGGIRTHPAHGREKLNLDTMAPNLSYLAPDGTVLESVALAPELHRNSIRHLALGPGGEVAFAMQWQGAPEDAPPLLGLHRRGEAVRLTAAPEPLHRALHGYAGSIAQAGTRIAITSPRGGQVHVFGSAGGFLSALPRADICGIGADGASFVATDGFGGISRIRGDSLTAAGAFARAWDNHLVTI